jgi:hypothetical protein
MDELESHAVCDAAIIAAAQKVEHYEIASYGTMKAWAEKLGLSDVVEQLNKSLEEEEEADRNLTAIAEAMANEEAAEGEEGDEEDDEAEVADEDESEAPVARKTAAKSAGNGRSRRRNRATA